MNARMNAPSFAAALFLVLLGDCSSICRTDAGMARCNDLLSATLTVVHYATLQNWLLGLGAVASFVVAC